LLKIETKYIEVVIVDGRLCHAQSISINLLVNSQRLKHHLNDVRFKVNFHTFKSYHGLTCYTPIIEAHWSVCKATFRRHWGVAQHHLSIPGRIHVSGESSTSRCSSLFSVKLILDILICAVAPDFGPSSASLHGSFRVQG